MNQPLKKILKMTHLFGRKILPSAAGLGKAHLTEVSWQGHRIRLFIVEHELEIVADQSIDWPTPQPAPRLSMEIWMKKGWMVLPNEVPI